MRAVVRRLFNMLVNNVREHFMIYLALWLLLAIIDLVWLWFSDGSGSEGSRVWYSAGHGFIKDFVAVFTPGAQLTLLLFR